MRTRKIEDGLVEAFREELCTDRLREGRWARVRAQCHTDGRQQGKDHISAEWVLSGPGLSNLLVTPVGSGI